MSSITIKNTNVLEAILMVPYDPKLIEVMSWLFSNETSGVITEGYRKKRHNNDLHGIIPVRAIDIRSWCYKYPGNVVTSINNEWSYDDTRPNKKVALYHTAKGGAPHIHIQVHPNTKRKTQTVINLTD